MGSARQRRAKTSGTMIQNASGTWRARLNSPDGTRVSLGSFRTKTEAQRALAVAVGEQSKGSWVNPQSGRVLFSEYAPEWVTMRAGIRPRTIELYESQVRVHLVPAFGDIPLAEITSAHVRRWYADMCAAERPSRTTVAKIYRLMRTILGTAVEDELIPKNPCSIKGAGVEKSAERPIATMDQVDALAKAIDPRFRALVYMATYTTLRFGELFALRRRNIDLDRATVTVLEQIGFVNGEMVAGPPKSDAGRRIVSIPASVIPEIREHLDRFVASDTDAFVFRGAKGALPARSNWSVLWRRVAIEAGVPGLRFHDLRHTGNTLAASTGASTKELMSRMGHASPRAALIYQHASREREDAIAAGLDRLLRNRSQRTS